jgi:hypothetical protein
MNKTNSKPQSPDAPKQDRPRPVHEVRLGRIKAAVWANNTEQGVRYSTTLTRLYRDAQDGEWRTSTSFGRDDLLLVAQVCELAIVWICHQGQQGQESAEVPF